MLSGAEKDATRIFEVLSKPEVGDYDLDHSVLLISPSLDEVRDALRRVFFLPGVIDTFTFFFAGHGAVSGGSFYMALKDSVSEVLSVSALSLGDLLRSLGEKAPIQSNLIIDACESGGLIADLGVLLKSNLVGNAGTPGVTLFATAAQDQLSSETAEGGLGTNALLDCIEGRAFVQDNSSVLDLVEIGRSISNRLKGGSQVPVVWGLNLYGPPGFCKNPRFATDPSSSLREVLQSWPPASDLNLHEHYNSLWQVYSSLSEDWSPRDFANVVDKILLPLQSTPEFLASFIKRFGDAALDRASFSSDPYRQAEVAAVLGVCLIPYLDDLFVRTVADGLLNFCGDAIMEAESLLISDLKSDQYSLLSRKDGGLADLYYLPIRLSKVLGWAAAAMEIFYGDSEKRKKGQKLFSGLLRLCLDHYGGAMVAVSDMQAPYWALALAGCKRSEDKDAGEELLGRIFYSLVTQGGNLSRWDMPDSKALEFLLCRAKNDFSLSQELVERPIETLTVLMKASAIFDLQDTLDESLWRIDGLSASAYLPSDYTCYGADMMKDGRNLVWGIGFDVFRVQDMLNSWPGGSTPRDASLRLLAVLSSLLFPNRVAWFLFDAELDLLPSPPPALFNT